MDIKIIILSIVSVLCLFLMLIIGARKEEDMARKSYIVVAFGALLWTMSNIVWTLTENNQLLWISGVLGYFSAIILGNSLYYFSFYFPWQDDTKRMKHKLIIFLAIFFIILTMIPNTILKGVDVEEGVKNLVTVKPSLTLLISYCFIMMILTFKNLIDKYKKANKTGKTQIKLIFTGLFIAFGFGGFFNLLLPLLFDNYQFVWLGPMFNLAMLTFIGYAILKHHLLGIKVALTETIVVIIGLIMLVEIFSAFNTSLLNLLFRIGLFLGFTYIGYHLIKSVLKEIERRQEIERIDKAKSEFISIASHQLRTPLTAIKGYISMILEGTYGKLAKKQIKPMENVYQSNERLIKLVNDLLNLSRLDAGKIKFEPVPTSLKQMINEIVNELKINAEKRKLYLRFHKTSKALPNIMVDQSQMRQVVLNIIDNAIKYTKKGGITVDLKEIDGYQEIRISDTGMGMNEKELQNIFQMFSRATAGNQLNTEGAGIGLHVAKRFVDMHEGKIWAESEGREKGTAFVIQLPTKISKKLKSQDFEKFIKI